MFLATSSVALVVRSASFRTSPDPERWRSQGAGHSAYALPNMPLTFQSAKLPNGLTVVAECDDAALTAAVGFFVKTGTRDEASAIMGVSHFLEHMMFKGTAKRSADDVNREFDDIGARANAYTSAEMTAFHAAVLPEHLGKATEILADMMRPALREEDFATEKGVILEEIAMYEDDPMWILYEQCMERHYGAHPLGHRVLGTKDTITALKAEQMRGYFDQRYSADKTVVALAGKVDFEAACEQIEQLCGSWASTPAGRHNARPATGREAFELRSDKVTRAYTLLLSAGPGSDDLRRYAAFVAAQALGGADNSRLHWALIETGIAEEASAGLEPHDGDGLFQVLVACEPERQAEAWSIAEREIRQLADTVTPEDVERIRAKVATGVTLSGERPDGRMHRLGRQWLYLGTYTTLEEELARIDAVTVGSVRELMAAFPMLPGTVGRLLPG